MTVYLSCASEFQERNRGLSADANKLHALRYLLIQLLLQLLQRPGEFTEAASELIICCRKAFSIHDPPESSEEDEAEDGESPELMDVLVDTLLSLLPQSSAPLRSAVEQVTTSIPRSLTFFGQTFLGTEELMLSSSMQYLSMPLSAF